MKRPYIQSNRPPPIHTTIILQTPPPCLLDTNGLLFCPIAYLMIIVRAIQNLFGSNLETKKAGKQSVNIRKKKQNLLFDQQP
ncbi:hypothetical protein DERP_002903 [Dermatophagoides pteronyssinus]|uniref:Transmembrane protein n=1 Tax=Dermatophagoides pteronyssinus TaxID=6956 RepID=A0ABQ8JW06_DERPT|nr:hypothetical protein DERP_002903 [Dermatophagoides pteronyssinus]